MELLALDDAISNSSGTRKDALLAVRAAITSEGCSAGQQVVLSESEKRRGFLFRLGTAGEADRRYYGCEVDVLEVRACEVHTVKDGTC